MQVTLERAIKAVIQEDVRIVGSGRTDAGAHAVGQVVAFSAETSLPPAVLCRAFNANLPEDVAVTSVDEVEPVFHPRFDACSRVYRYLIWNRPVRSPFWNGRAAHVERPLDERLMDEVAGRLLGRHDFSAFVPARLEGSRERVVYRARCFREGELVVVELEASGFMRHMIRTAVGTLVQIGLGKHEPHWLEQLLQTGDRSAAGAAMPARGLYLVAVTYPAPIARESRIPVDNHRLLPTAPAHSEESA